MWEGQKRGEKSSNIANNIAKKGEVRVSKGGKVRLTSFFHPKKREKREKWEF